MIKQNFSRTRKQLLSFVRWRYRLVFWSGAVVVGLIAAAYAFIADYAQKLFGDVVHLNQYLPLIVSPVLFALAAWMTSRFSPGAVGSGIPQAIAARIVRGPYEQRYLLGSQIIFGKILFTTLALLGGASVGREGPTVQIGAAILYLGVRFGRVSEELSRSVILAGAAAGVAAAFNTPLAGIVFAIEEMARAFETRYSGIVLTAIVLAGASSLSILGNYTYFGTASGDFSLSRDWIAILVVGVVSGLFGGIFSRILIDGGPALFSIFKGKKFIGNIVWFAALCGLVIAALGIVTHGATYGSGYEQAKSLLNGEVEGSWSYTFAKFTATAISGFSGLPGGIFSPSLSVGAGFGASMASWFPDTPVAGMVLLGMTAYFAGVTQAPITAFIIVLEITGGQSMPVPLIATSVIAVAVSRVICPISLYHALAKSFISKAKQYEAERTGAVA